MENVISCWRSIQEITRCITFKNNNDLLEIEGKASK
jgi:hypothetical protein